MAWQPTGQPELGTEVAKESVAGSLEEEIRMRSSWGRL